MQILLATILIGWTVMTESGRDARAAILEAAQSVLEDRGLVGATFDRIAKKAGCAKGLVNYHFASRIALLSELVSAIVDRLWTARVAGLSANGPAVVDETWKVLLAERESSIHLALAGLASMRCAELIDRQFRLTQQSMMARWRDATAAWLRRSRFRTDGQEEVARAAAALLDGFAARLSTDDPDELYPAYLTAWVGLIAALSGSHG